MRATPISGWPSSAEPAVSPSRSSRCCAHHRALWAWLFWQIAHGAEHTGAAWRAESRHVAWVRLCEAGKLLEKHFQPHLLLASNVDPALFRRVKARAPSPPPRVAKKKEQVPPDKQGAAASFFIRWSEPCSVFLPGLDLATPGFGSKLAQKALVLVKTHAKLPTAAAWRCRCRRLCGPLGAGVPPGRMPQPARLCGRGGAEHVIPRATRDWSAEPHFLTRMQNLPAQRTRPLMIHSTPQTMVTPSKLRASAALRQHVGAALANFVHVAPNGINDWVDGDEPGDTSCGTG